MREGLIPTLLGTAVTGIALATRMSDIREKGMQKRRVGPMIATGLAGFGLAHIVLGSIDLFQGR